ncbi:MAG: alpha/beta fold hydrolase [Actinobacteria bacterium]|nr:alpha/beta fold hydrolase [Actinomycetota bacterium]
MPTAPLTRPVASRPAVAHGIPLKRIARAGPADLAYLESGGPAGPLVVFVHGFPTHAHLWRRVMRRLGDGVHALAPDLLGLGDTVVSPYQDLSPPFQAEILLGWLTERGDDRVVLVGHEQGGAVVQQIVANHPERVAGVVLVDTVAYDNWPVPLAAQVMRLARTPGVDALAYAFDLPRRIARNGALGFRRAVRDKAAITDETLEEYLRPLGTAEGRERARRFLLAGDARWTLECLPGLRAYDGPIEVVWGLDDPFLSPSWGARLRDDLPAVRRLELVPFCGHLLPEERPDVVAGVVRRVLDDVVGA